MPNSSKVSVGLATIAGYLTGIGGIVNTVAIAISGSKAELAGPGKWTAILGVASIIAIGLGRQLQATGIRIPAAVGQVVDALPTLEQELAAPPPAQAAVVPDGSLPAAPPAAAAPAA
jgi:hypothetical protein